MFAYSTAEFGFASQRRKHGGREAWSFSATEMMGSNSSNSCGCLEHKRALLQSAATVSAQEGKDIPGDVCHSCLIMMFDYQKDPPTALAFLAELAVIMLSYGC